MCGGIENTVLFFFLAEKSQTPQTIDFNEKSIQLFSGSYLVREKKNEILDIAKSSPQAIFGKANSSGKLIFDVNSKL